MTSRSALVPFVFAGLLSLAASACSKADEQPKPAAVPPTEITSELKQGQGVDLVLSIRQQDVSPDGSRVLQAGGTYKGAEVGLIVVLGAKWDSVVPDPKSPFVFHTGTVEYRTLGAASDALLAALDELYETKLHPSGMRKETKFAGASLEGDPADLGKGEVRLKLGFESPDPERVAELYTNIDLPKHQLRIREKDESFRKAIVQALAKE